MTFHWWNTEKLVAELAEGRVSEKQSAQYAMLGAVLYYQGIYTATWFGGYRSWLLIYEFFVVSTIALVGISECLKANGGNDGRDFLKRYALISVPVGLKLALAGIVVSRVIYYGFPYVVTPVTFRDPVFVYQLIWFISSAAIAATYFWRIKIRLTQLAQTPLGGRPISRET